jgi:hypothetical protein
MQVDRVDLEVAVLGGEPAWETVLDIDALARAEGVGGGGDGLQITVRDAGQL